MARKIHIKYEIPDPLQALSEGHYEAAIRAVTIADSYALALGSLPCAAYDPVRRLYIATPLPPVTEAVGPEEPPERYNVMAGLVGEIQQNLWGIFGDCEEVYFD